MKSAYGRSAVLGVLGGIALVAVVFFLGGCRVQQSRRTSEVSVAVRSYVIEPAADARLDLSGSVSVAANAQLRAVTSGDLSQRRWMRIRYKTERDGCRMQWEWLNSIEITKLPADAPLVVTHEASLFRPQADEVSCADVVQDAVFYIFTLDDKTLDEVPLIEVGPVHVGWKVS